MNHPSLSSKELTLALHRLTETLQQLSKALSAAATPTQSVSFSTLSFDTDVDNMDVDEEEEADGEHRHYHFPPLALRMESEMLAKEKTDSLEGVLTRICETLDCYSSLLKNTAYEAAMDGTTLQNLGYELEQVKRRVFRIQDTYSTVSYLPER